MHNIKLMKEQRHSKAVATVSMCMLKQVITASGDQFIGMTVNTENFFEHFPNNSGTGLAEVYLEGAFDKVLIGKRTL